MTLGVDVGGTKIAGVRATPTGEVLSIVRRETPAGASAVIAAIDAVIDELLEGADPATPIGLGVPGCVDADGTLQVAPNLQSAAGICFPEALARRPVVVENDATLATFAEHRRGAARGVADAVLVTLGTGIGGGIVAGGRLLLGTHGYAGEFGHLVLDPQGPPCVCGRRGCWERYASGAGLARLRGDRLCTRDILAAALDGDPLACEIASELGGWVALGLANLAQVLDPDLFVIGGGLVVLGDVLLDPVRRLLPDVSIVPARFGELAGAVGAALAALDGGIR